MAKEKVRVTERALIQRINRKLRADDEVLKISRDERSNLGEFYIVNIRVNAVAGKDVDIERFGRQLGVLKSWEALARPKLSTKFLGKTWHDVYGR